jgi:Tfp pilus assembly protein PilN
MTMTTETTSEQQALSEMIDSVSELKRYTLEAFTRLNAMHERLAQARNYPVEVMKDIIAPMPEELVAIMARLDGGCK